jgi:hypothetical protein
MYSWIWQLRQIMVSTWLVIPRADNKFCDF